VIGIVDYGMGNRRSVEKALEHVGARPALTDDHATLRAADGLVLPGVGAFPAAMRALAARGLDELVVERARAGVPVIGLCLGMQLLFERSSEFEGADGLGLIPGVVDQLDPGGRRLPHIGWNLVSFERESALTAGLGEAAAFYHVHSFVVRPADEADVVGRGEYGERFVSLVERDVLFGAQFHPEKSSRDGLALLASFARVCARVAA
jgi:imidazole glycerol-phosphate synthase subunit HisH